MIGLAIYQVEIRLADLLLVNMLCCLMFDFGYCFEFDLFSLFDFGIECYFGYCFGYCFEYYSLYFGYYFGWSFEYHY